MLQRFFAHLADPKLAVLENKIARNWKKKRELKYRNLFSKYNFFYFNKNFLPNESQRFWNTHVCYKSYKYNNILTKPQQETYDVCLVEKNQSAFLAVIIWSGFKLTSTAHIHMLLFDDSCRFCSNWQRLLAPFKVKWLLLMTSDHIIHFLLLDYACIPKNNTNFDVQTPEVSNYCNAPHKCPVLFIRRLYRFFQWFF